MRLNWILVKYIQSHGKKARDCGYKIAVLDETIVNGKLHKEIVYIDPTYKAVREWLGY